MTKTEQTELFKDEARRKELSYKIPDAYRKARQALPDIGDKATFFKTFSQFAKSLDTEKDRAVILGNLEVAEHKVGDLLAAVKEASEGLNESFKMEAEMQELEEKLGIPMDKRWKSLGYSAQGLDGDGEGDFDEEEQYLDENKYEEVAEEEKSRDSA